MGMLGHYFDLLFTYVLPFLLRVTALYILFSLTVCAASALDKRVAERFSTSRARTIPFFLLAAGVFLARLA